MIATVHAKQQRLAQHYLQRLHTALSVYSRGDDDSVLGLKVVEADWGQIQQWQSWSAAHAERSPEAAALCAAYPLEAGEMLDLLLTPIEHLAWREAALAAARQTGDERAALLHLLAIAEIRSQLAQPELAIATLEPALELARYLDDTGSLTHCLILMGNSLVLWKRDYEAAQHLFDQALKTSQQTDNRSGEARARMLLGMLAYQREQWDVSANYLNASLRSYEQLGDQRGMATCLNRLGFLHELQQAYDQASAYLEASMRLFRQLGDRDSVADNYRMLGGLAAKTGNLHEARQHYGESLEIYRAIGNPRGMAMCLTDLAVLSVLEQNYSTAYSEATEGLRFHRQLGFKGTVAFTLLQLTSIHWGLGELDKLKGCLLEGLSIACEENYTELIRDFLIGSAVLYGTQGNPERGAALLGIVVAHDPGGTRRSYVAQAFEFLQTQCSPETLHAAFERGKTLDLDTAAREVLAELQAGSP